MIKYLAAAAALKLFSISPQTKRFYRHLGNTVGQQRRIRRGLPPQYLDRAKRLLALCERLDAARPGDRLLELGTGWLHWESAVLRLFHDVEIHLFDVWDNRQLGAFKAYFRRLDEVMDDELTTDDTQRERAHALLRAVLAADSFDDVYELLGFQYEIDARGSLERFRDDSFNLVFSCNVLEHVDRESLPRFIADVRRVLKPGGLSIHQIDLGDHLAYYDGGVSVKNYLRYPDKAWKRFFENEVQYFNRVQRPEWLEVFRQAGLELREEEAVAADIGAIEIEPSRRGLDDGDLRCKTLRLVHTKAR